jgi:hypothetical protein
MKRARCAVVGLCLFSVLACRLIWGQATAQISGTVKDQSGAVLPGVEITATQTQTGIARSGVTNETGSFTLPNLPLGAYRLEAGLPGFRTYVQAGIVLQVNSSPVLNIAMEVGQVTEQVEVQANAAMVETRAVGVGQVIENERILELPLNGRQATELIVLTGAAVQENAPNAKAMVGSVATSVAGSVNTGTVYLLDGAIHNDPFTNLNLPVPFPDALQEFKVETSALSAQHGMYSGAVVSLVTKSGTNQFHGDLFEFVRNDLFNARNYFATKNSTLKRNQFGGTIGGPILANKLFFFGGYQGTTVRQDPQNTRAFVPSAAMLAGDFTAATSPQCRSGGQLTLKAPFVNNGIDPSLFSKAAVAIANKLPKTMDPCGLVTYNIRTVTNDYQITGKVDYQKSNKHSIFGRYLATKFDQPLPFSFEANLLNTPNNGLDNLGQSFAFGDTYLLGPTMVNAFRLAVNRTAVNRTTAQTFAPPDVGVKAYAYYPILKMAITGAFTAQPNGGPVVNNTYQMSEDLSIVHGAHQWSIGANVAHWRAASVAYVFSPGQYTFNGQVTGLGLADFLTGNLSQLLQAAPNSTYVSNWSVGVYLADSWRLTPRLTMSYGLRWEPGIAQVIRNGVIANFDEERYRANLRTSVFKNAPAGFTYPGDPGFPNTHCRPSGVCSASGRENQWALFSPRLGFAWDPEGNGRTSVRIAYGMAYDMLSSGFWTTYITPPWKSSIIVPQPAGGFDDPWRDYPGGNPFPIGKLNADIPYPADQNYFVVAPHNPPSARHEWNLSIQRQISADWLVSASYLGSQADHLWKAQELNPAVYIPGGPCTLRGVVYNPCSQPGNSNARRKLALQNPNVGGTTMAFLDRYEGQGTQTYNGMLLSVQRRSSSGVTIGGNYTWSHCYGNAASLDSGGTPGTTYLNPDDRSFDRGNCSSDRRHIFNMTAVAEMPRLGNTALRRLTTGWRLGGIYRRSSGSWLTILSGQDRQLSGVAGQRAQQILENPYGDKSSLTKFLNPAAFTVPALGTLGNMRPLNIQGPGTWQFDLALSRVFQLRENNRLEVRAEAFNVTNGLRRGNPQTNFTASDFGQISTSADPRIMQFALKFVF